MRVHWTETALGHLIAIHDYIAQDAPFFARSFVDRLTGRSQQIGQFPESRRIVPEYEEDDLREVIEDPYRVIYRILPQRIDVLAVVHTARRLPRLR